MPHLEYVAALLEDLDQDLKWAQGRPLSSIFIGGGTPSLLTVEAMQALLDGVRARIPLTADCEITMEANPGTVEADKLPVSSAPASTVSPSGCRAFSRRS